ncbi:hypothetical protein EVAR_98458_1 [Eumeta japonica]|uniref:Uncharacterized protein n=1 Tax=Eumeta variegata TaxID=151549 RepID=A0A4C1YTZ2_EUMVA|nr:hypothetical protein EVAR_98458_1 [Eumeta japonica]
MEKDVDFVCAGAECRRGVGGRLRPLCSRIKRRPRSESTGKSIGIENGIRTGNGTARSWLEVEAASVIGRRTRLLFVVSWTFSAKQAQHSEILNLNTDGYYASPLCPVKELRFPECQLESGRTLQLFDLSRAVFANFIHSLLRVSFLPELQAYSPDNLRMQQQISITIFCLLLGQGAILRSLSLPAPPQIELVMSMPYIRTAFKRPTVRVRQFKHGRVNFSDEFCGGRPSTTVNNEKIDAVRRMIGTDRHVTYHEIQASLGIATRNKGYNRLVVTGGGSTPATSHHSTGR